MDAEFGSRVAIITGAASGISRIILTRFAQAGACAVLVDINADWGEAVERELTGQGHEVFFQRTDVRDSVQVDAMVAATIERFGRVDILVHGAGVGVHKEVVELSDDEWDLQIDVQLRGAFLLSRAVGRMLIEQGEGGADHPDWFHFREQRAPEGGAACRLEGRGDSTDAGHGPRTGTLRDHG